MSSVNLIVQGSSLLSQTYDVAREQINGSASVDNLFVPSPSNANTVPHAPVETGLAAHIRVSTPDGSKAIGDLVPGDYVTDRTGAVSRVDHILISPATQNALLFRAPYFGLNQDLVLGQFHRIAITSDIAEYMFGEETVMLPAWALKDGMKVKHLELGSADRLYQIQLDTGNALNVGACVVESLPKHGHSPLRILSDDEARSFVIEHRH